MERGGGGKFVAARGEMKCVEGGGFAAAHVGRDARWTGVGGWGGRECRRLFFLLSLLIFGLGTSGMPK